MSGSADKDERAALIRRLREGQCADNMGCGTMKMCVCANATDAADYLEKLAAVPECGRRFDLAASLKELRDRWASIVESQNWGDQFDGDFTTLDELHAHLTGAENCPDGEAVSGCGTTNGPGGRAPASGSGGDDAGPTPAAPPTNPSASAGSTPAGSASLSAIGTLLKVDERDPNHRECQRQDAALVHRILRLQEEVAKQHRAACDATGEAIHWKKVAQGNSPFTEVRSTRQPSDFTLDVCEALFGCFLDDGYEDDPHGTFRCGQCHEPIKITEWVNATHASSCIINKVRNVLREHRPAAAPLSARQPRKEKS